MKVISVENLSKTYRLGQIGTGTFTNDLKLWWAKARGKPNPLLRIGESDHGNRDGEDLWALQNVSFTVEKGEVLGIIGRNGAGKSTLLKILSRVTAPTSGKIKLRGRVASLLEVGTGFHPELTGRENIYLNGAILGMSRREIDRKFDEIVDFAEVEKFIDTPVKRYSSGMYVRLAFAVAAHLEPEILVVDEVLAVGDAEFQKKCLGKMSDISHEGRTVLFVSHNMGAITSLCSRVIGLRAGEIIDTGLATDVVKRYISNARSAGLSSLRERKERLGNGEVKFTSIRFLFKNDMETDALICGQESKIELFYEADQAIENLGKLSVSITFAEMNGNNLFCLWDRLVNTEIRNLPSTGRLICRIPKLPLMPGRYSLLLAMTHNGILVDKVSDAAEITVVEGDFFNSGMLPPQNLAIVLVEHNWTFSV